MKKLQLKILTILLASASSAFATSTNLSEDENNQASSSRPIENLSSNEEDLVDLTKKEIIELHLYEFEVPNHVVGILMKNTTDNVKKLELYKLFNISKNEVEKYMACLNEARQSVIKK